MDDDTPLGPPGIEGAIPASFRGKEVRPVRPRKRQDRQSREDAKKHFKQLAEATEQAHEILERENAPYRFCVYEKDGEVFIDMVILGPDGKTQKILKKNISHEEYTTYLSHIEHGDGLIIDKTI